jgi:FdhE protein
VYDWLVDRQLSGVIEQDVSLLADAGSAVLDDVAVHGPAPLAVEARALLARDTSALATRLVDYWHMRSDREFFAKAIVQPYAERCAEVGVAGDRSPERRALHRSESLDRSRRSASLSGEREPVYCPRCGGAPQLSILEAAGPDTLEGGSRDLLCATCLTRWPCRRVLCPACGEDDERKLGYFHSSALEHVRVDACDSCRHYLKTIDRSRLGLAVPLVDEVAGAPLDVWAQEHGYNKLELNLVGL